MLVSKISERFTKHSSSRIYQGDIIRDLKFLVVETDGTVIELEYPYAIVMSQDCDLQQAKNKGIRQEDKVEIQSQFLPNVLLLPAFVGEAARSGDHLIKIYDIRQERIVSRKWDVVKRNGDDRYHYLPKKRDIQVPELLVDFKHYFTLSYDILFNNYSKRYLATVNELFRENLSHRFTNYLARIGLPELK